MDITPSIGGGDLDPVAERLLRDARTRETLRLKGRERATRWASAAAFVTASGLLLAFAPPARAPSFLLLASVLVAYALASRIEFEVGSGLAVPTELVLVPMLFVLPLGLVPFAVAMGLVLGSVPEFVTGRESWERAVVAIASAWHSLGPVLVLLALGEPSAEPGVWWALALALAAQFALDFASAAAGEWLALGLSPRELVRPMLWVFTVDALLAPAGLAAAIAAGQSDFAMFLPLSLLALLALFARQRSHSLDQALELSTAYQGTAYLLGDVIESDHEYTGSHSRAVVDLTLSVCDELGLDPRQRRLAELTALLHDVGKIRVPREILDKPGTLTAEERAIIDQHTIEGERLLEPVGGLLEDVARIVRSCHERYDGQGYPDGLAGDEIPLVARIVSCCDAYHAMTTDRPYRRALATSQALAELTANRGTQFDPAVVDALLVVLPSHGIRDDSSLDPVIAAA
jgi:putative nucleotidyltransferase with HDIG domain